VSRKKNIRVIPEVTTRPRLEAFVRKHVFNAAGSTGYIQINESGSFGANEAFVFDRGDSGIEYNVGIGIVGDPPDGLGTRPKTHLDVNHGYLDYIVADTGGGDIVQIGSATTTVGKLYYLETSGVWEETDANILASGSTQLLAIALGTNASNDGMLIRGFFNMDSYLGSFSKGVPAYVSTTAGEATLTPPGGSNFVRVIGHCTNDSKVIYFNPNEVSGSGAGDTSPGGSNTQVQYNDGGSFQGSSNFTFDGTTVTGSFSGSLAEFTNLSVCGGTASIAHLAGCSPITVHSPMIFKEAVDFSSSAVTGSSIKLTGFLSVAGVGNTTTITAPTTIPSNYNSILYGPITIGNGGELTIGADSVVKIKDISDA